MRGLLFLITRYSSPVTRYFLYSLFNLFLEQSFEDFAGGQQRKLFNEEDVPGNLVARELASAKVLDLFSRDEAALAFDDNGGGRLAPFDTPR
jgi:hypothetical protein